MRRRNVLAAAAGAAMLAPLGAKAGALQQVLATMVPSAVDPVIWDPMAQGSLFTINSTGLTASLTSGGWQTVRTSHPQSSGKWYIEIVVTAAPSSGVIYGVANFPLAPNVLQGYLGSTSKSFGMRVSGSAFVSGVTADYTSGFSASQGDRIMLALDVDNGRVYVGKNGTWANSGDPAAGTGCCGHWTPVAGEAWGFGSSVQAGGSVYTSTLVPSGFAYSVPAGFAALPTSTRSSVNSRVSVWTEGDSITNGVASGVTGYPNLFVPTYQLAVGGNLATSGATVATLTSRSVDGFRPGTLQADVRRYALTVLIGNNDLSNGDSAATLLSNLATYLDARRTAGWYVGVCTLLPSTTSGFNAKRNTANATISTWVGSHADFLIDFAADPIMGPDAAASDTSLYQDGRHPTALGQSYLQSIFASALAAI